MNRRPLSLAVVFCFFIGASAVAQFPLKKKKEEKPKEEKAAEKPAEKSEAAPAASSATLKAVTWADNAVTFEVPDNWQPMMEERDMLSYMLMPVTDSAGLTATISRLGKDFPADASLKANRDAAAKKKEKGEVTALEDVALGKVKGVMYVEAPPASPDDVRRLTWIGFQKRDGWNQITIHLSATSAGFPNHEATFRQVLSTFKIDSD